MPSRRPSITIRLGGTYLFSMGLGVVFTLTGFLLFHGVGDMTGFLIMVFGFLLMSLLLGARLKVTVAQDELWVQQWFHKRRFDWQDVTFYFGQTVTKSIYRGGQISTFPIIIRGKSSDGRQREIVGELSPGRISEFREFYDTYVAALIAHEAKMTGWEFKNGFKLFTETSAGLSDHKAMARQAKRRSMTYTGPLGIKTFFIIIVFAIILGGRFQTNLWVFVFLFIAGSLYLIPTFLSRRVTIKLTKNGNLRLKSLTMSYSIDPSQLKLTIGPVQSDIMGDYRQVTWQWCSEEAEGQDNQVKTQLSTHFARDFAAFVDLHLVSHMPEQPLVID